MDDTTATGKAVVSAPPPRTRYWPSLEKFYGKPNLPPPLAQRVVNIMQVAAAPFFAELNALKRKKPSARAERKGADKGLENQLIAHVLSPPAAEPAPPGDEPELPPPAPAPTAPSKHLRKARRLNKRLCRALAHFEYLALTAGQAPRDVHTAHYMLCALADEVAMASKLNQQGHWAANTLLSRWHNEAQGGDRFFQYLERLQAMPGANLDLLELAYVCLSLGFQGRMATLPEGADGLEALRADLFKHIMLLRGEPHAQLSPQWQPLRVEPRKTIRIIPAWLIVTATLVTLGIMYSGFSSVLAHKREQVLELYLAPPGESAP